MRIFALIVGINKYKTVSPLNGCITDAQNFNQYLAELHSVPPSNILTLLDEQATRDAIIASFRSFLIDNPNIRWGDCMIFFFAGHGSRVSAPEGWSTNDDQIETICPVDEGMLVVDATTGGVLTTGIPDLTLNALICDLARNKGDNILVILDCCHSGGATRLPHLIPRSIDVRYGFSVFPARPDRELWMRDTTALGRRSRESHVLLAACSQNQVAYETKEGGGCFTTALIKQLRCATSNTTYDQLISSLPKLPNQNPQSYGLFNRALFNAQVVKDLFAVKQLANGKLHVDIGALMGVTPNATFSLFSDGQELGILTVEEITPFSSVLAGATSTMPYKTLAVRMNPMANDLSILNIFLLPSNPHYNLGDLIKKSQISHSFRRVHSRSHAHVELSLSADGNEMTVQRLDPLFRSHSTSTVSLKVPERSQVPLILNSIAHFRFQLGRHLLSHDVKLLDKLSSTCEDGSFNGIRLRLFELTSSSNGFRVPGDEIRFAGGNHATVKEGKKYGIELSNDSVYDVYPYLFYFDPNDYKIQKWYHPSRDVPPLCGPRTSRTKVTVGYGAGGGYPIVFTSGESGFLKLFVSSHYIDMTSLEQDGILSARKGLRVRDDTQIWGAWVVAITAY